jgi:hypothetical protein
MEVTVNTANLNDFLIDSEGKIRAPMYFDLNNDLGETAKELFKILAGYCVVNNAYKIPPRDFQNLVDQYFPLNKKTILAVVELKQNNYIDIN